MGKSGVEKELNIILREISYLKENILIPDDEDIIIEVVSAAKDRGSLVFADTKLPNFKKLSLEDIRGALPFVDYITPNEDEARYFSGKSEPEEMADAFIRVVSSAYLTEDEMAGWHH